MRKLLTVVSALGLAILLSACSRPIYLNSVVSNDLEFITRQDAHAFVCLDYVGRERREMPDRRSNQRFADDTFIFAARFDDRNELEIWAHPRFGTVKSARRHVEMIVRPLGRLPSFMRQRLSHVVLHEGDEVAFAQDKGHFFVLYSENVKRRIRSHDIEETIFHEAVHATLDDDYRRGTDWLEAQQADGAYVTYYAANNPDTEDMAESALFAYTLLHHPGRLPVHIEQEVQLVMPNRLAYFEKLFEKLAGTVTEVDQPPDCSS